MNSNFFRVWKFPVLLGVLTLGGLLSALTGTGLWHFFSWTTMSLPILVCVRYGLFLRKQQS
jgi:hypothetical protein